jgi:3-keto-L-gulonate-6-phosphate decarboxylase
MRQVELEWVVLHRGTDEALSGQEQTGEHFGIIADAEALGLKVSVAGGVSLEIWGLYVAHPVCILVVGHTITGTAEPQPAAQAFRQCVNALWPEPLSA